MQTSQSIKEIANALCKFQQSISVIKKTEDNPFFKSKYASLPVILAAIKQPLAEVGLSIAQFPIDSYGLETVLMHISGEFMSATFYMKPTKDDPQGAGSCITYQRRYALGAILGLSTDEDDDGNLASSETPKSAAKRSTGAKDTIKFTEDELQQIASQKIHPEKTGEKNGRKWYLYNLNGQKGFVSQEQQAYITSFAPTVPLDELAF